jgi:hypothetical protein
MYWKSHAQQNRERDAQNWNEQQRRDAVNINKQNKERAEANENSRINAEGGFPSSTPNRFASPGGSELTLAGKVFFWTIGIIVSLLTLLIIYGACISGK